MKTQMRSAGKMVRRAILGPGFLGRIKESLVVVAMLSMALVVVLVLSAKNTHGGENANADPDLTATRCIVTPDGVTPDSKFVVMVELHPKNESKGLELHEKIPKDWIVTPINSAGAKPVGISESNSYESIWTWGPLPGDIKTIFYYVTVPSTTKEGNYQISGEIVKVGNNEQTVEVGGEVAVNVKKRLEDVAKLRISIRLAIVVVLIILVPFGLILFLGWYKDKKLDKGDMRRAIAGTFVVGFTLLMMLSVSFDIYQKEVILMYIQLAGVVVAFYFGAKLAAEIPCVGTKIETGNPTPDVPPDLPNNNPPT